MSRSSLIFLSACGAAWLLLYQLIALQDQTLVVKKRQRFEGPPLLEIRPSGRDAQTLPVKVLFIHGLSASKSALRQMAAELTRWGCHSYLIDLPGHGDSPDQFSLEATEESVDLAVRALLANSDQAKPLSQPLVVIGHSFGARVALGAARRHPQVAAVIALSPAAEPIPLKATVPLLLVIGEFDFPFVRRGAAFLYGQVTGTRLSRIEGPGQWQNAAGPCRLVVLPWSDHSQTLFRARSLDEIKMWIGRVSPAMNEAAFSPASFWMRTQLRAAFCIVSLLVWFPLVALLVDVLLPERRKSSISLLDRVPGGGVELVWVYAMGALLAILFLHWVNPWEELGLMGGAYLTGLLCATGIVGLAVLRPFWIRTYDEWRALLCSFLAWMLLVLGYSPWVTEQFVHLNLNSGRVWRLPWIVLSVLPFFVLDEQVSRHMLRGVGVVRIAMFHLSTRFILAVALLLGFFVLRNGQFLVVLVLPGLLLTSLLCWLLAAWIHRKTDSVAASGLFVALATGWFVSVFFAQL